MIVNASHIESCWKGPEANTSDWVLIRPPQGISHSGCVAIPNKLFETVCIPNEAFFPLSTGILRSNKRGDVSTRSNPDHTMLKVISINDTNASILKDVTFPVPLLA